MQVRIVNVDFYMHQPIPNLDPVYSDFRGSSTHQVPVLRIFGSTETGIKTCLHVHGVFPYIFIPYDGENSIDSVMYQLAASLDEAINISLGQKTSNIQHIFKISLVHGIPFYGYHAKHHQFFKIYFYNPLIVKKACTLLQSGNIMGKIFQPHEAHIPYVLQFMIDYNLYGMSFINLSEVKYRRNPDLTDIPEELTLPPSVEKITTCKLEIDVLAEYILNRLEVNSQNLGSNPGIQALWDDERQRRRDVGSTSLVENYLTQNRSDIKPTSTHLAFMNVLKEKLNKPAKMEESKSQNLSVYPAETPRDNIKAMLSASIVENHTISTQSSDSTFLDFTITPEDNDLNLTLDSDARKLLQVLNDLRENVETENDSILSQTVPEQDSDTEQNDIDMSLPLDYVKTPPKNHSKELDATLKELDDSYFNISIDIPQLDGCDDTLPHNPRRGKMQKRKRKQNGNKGMRKRKGGTSSSSLLECSQEISMPIVYESPNFTHGSISNDTFENTEETLIAKSQSEIINLISPPKKSSNDSKADTSVDGDDLNFKSFSSKLRSSKISQSSFIEDSMDLSSDNSAKLSKKSFMTLRSGHKCSFNEKPIKCRYRNSKVNESSDTSSLADLSHTMLDSNKSEQQFMTLRSGRKCSFNEKPIKRRCRNCKVNKSSDTSSLVLEDRSDTVLDINKSKIKSSRSPENDVSNIIIDEISFINCSADNNSNADERLNSLSSSTIPDSLDTIEIYVNCLSEIDPIDIENNNKTKKFTCDENTENSDVQVPIHSNLDDLIQPNLKAQLEYYSDDKLHEFNTTVVPSNVTKRKQPKRRDWKKKTTLNAKIVHENNIHSNNVLFEVDPLKLTVQNRIENMSEIETIIITDNENSTEANINSNLSKNDFHHLKMDTENVLDNFCRLSDNKKVGGYKKKNNLVENINKTYQNNNYRREEKSKPREFSLEIDPICDKVATNDYESSTCLNMPYLDCTTSKYSNYQMPMNLYNSCSTPKNKSAKISHKYLLNKRKENKLIREINIFEDEDKILRNEAQKKVLKRSPKNKSSTNGSSKNESKNISLSLPNATIEDFNLGTKFESVDLSILKKKSKATNKNLFNKQDPSNVQNVTNKKKSKKNRKPTTIPVVVHIPILDTAFSKTSSSCYKKKNNRTVNFFGKITNPRFTIVPSAARPYKYSLKGFEDIKETFQDTRELLTNFPNTKWHNNRSSLTDKYPPEKRIKIHSIIVLTEKQKIDLSMDQTSYGLNHSTLFPTKTTYSNRFFSDFKRLVLEEFESCYNDNEEENKPTISFDNKNNSLCESEDNFSLISEDIDNRIETNKLIEIQKKKLKDQIDAKINSLLSSEETAYSDLMQRIEGRFTQVFKDVNDIQLNSSISFSKILNHSNKSILPKLPVDKDSGKKEKAEMILSEIDSTSKKGSLKQVAKNENIIDCNYNVLKEVKCFDENISKSSSPKVDERTIRSVKPKNTKLTICDYVKMESLKYMRKEKAKKVNNSDNLFGFETKRDVDERDKLGVGSRWCSSGGGTFSCNTENKHRRNNLTNLPRLDTKFSSEDNTPLRHPVNQYNFLDGTNDSSSSDEDIKISKTVRKRAKTFSTQSSSKYMPLDVKCVSPTKKITLNNAAPRIQSQDINTNIRVKSQPPHVAQKHRRKLSFSKIRNFNTTQIQEKVTCRFTPEKVKKKSAKIYIDCDTTDSDQSNINEQILPNLDSDSSSNNIMKISDDAQKPDGIIRGVLEKEINLNASEENEANLTLLKTLTPSKNSSSSSQLSDDLFSPDSDAEMNFKKTGPAEKYDVEKRYIPLAGSSKMEPQFQKLFSQKSDSSSTDALTPYQKENGFDQNTPFDIKSNSEMILSKSNEFSSGNLLAGVNKSNTNVTMSSLQLSTDSANEIISGKFEKSDGATPQILNKEKERLILAPNYEAPSREIVENSLKTYNIPEVRYPQPFYSDRKDVTGNIEVGRNVLKIPSNNTVDLPQFQTSFDGIEQQRKRSLKVLEFDNKKPTAKEILEYKLSISENVPVLITLGKSPPSRKEVEEWSQKQKTNKKVELCDKPKQKNNRVYLLNSPGRDGEESFDSLSLSPCTPIDADSTVLKLDDKLNDTKFDYDAVDNKNHEQNSPTLKEKSNSDKKRKSRIRHVKEYLPKKMNCPEMINNSKIENDYNPRDDPNNLMDIHEKNDENLMDQNLSKSDSSKILSSNDTLVRNLASNTTTNSHRITGATLDNENNFLMLSHNLNEAKAIKEHLNLTILSIEVIAITRNEYKPNPEMDQIKAIIFTLYINETTSSGGFIVNSLSHSPTKIKNSVLNGIDAKYNIIGVDSELELINRFVDYVKDHDPDIFIGFEIELLSWGFLIERGYTLGLDLTILLSRIPNITRKKKFDEYDLVIPGRILIDFWRLLRHEIALTSYTFENVVYHILHQRVPLFSHKDLTCWIQHSTSVYRGRVIQYYSFKTEAVVRIMEQLDLIGRTSELAKLFGIQFYEVLSRGSQFRVESMMLRLAKPLNFIPVSPNVQQRAKMRAPESLPLIMEPESKFYTDPVIVLDFQSLYPSMIIAYNYCFSTCLGRIEHLGEVQPFEFGATHLKVPRKYLKYFLKKEKLNISPCGIAFVNKSIRLGILPKMLQEILDTRLMVKESLKKNKTNKVLAKVLDARQLGLKLIANVTYGYTAANFSGRMPCIELGDSIVSKGRETLQRAIDLVEKTSRWEAKVVYGDTDSLFVLIPGKSREAAFKIGAEIAEAVTNDNPSPVKLKLEKILQPCILQTKKRYVGYMYESPNQSEPEFLAKGIETVRRDGCPASAKMLEKCLKMLFDTCDVSLVKKYVTRQFGKLLTGRVSIQDLTFAKEYRGSSNYRPGACVPALELARKWTSIDKRNEPRKGERVPYVIVNGHPGQPLIKLVRSPKDLLNDPSLRPNALYYITKVIIPPINRCFLLIGADLNQWFSEMPRKQFQYLPTSSPGKNKPRKNTITQFFSTLDCAICGNLTQDGICTNCKLKPQETSVLLHEKLRLWERNYHNTLLICHSCCGRQDEISCISLDCPVYYRRIQTDRDLQQSGFIRQLIGTLPDIQF